MCKTTRSGERSDRAACLGAVRPWASTDILAVRGKIIGIGAYSTSMMLEMLRLCWRAQVTRSPGLAPFMSALAEASAQLD